MRPERDGHELRTPSSIRTTPRNELRRWPIRAASRPCWRCPDRALHRRELARRQRRRNAPRRGPLHRGDARRGRRRAARGCARRARRGRRAPGRVGRAARRASAGEILRRAYEALIARARGARAADDARDGQGARRVARRDRLRRRVPALVLRGGRAHPRPLHGQHDRQRAHPHDAPAGRAVRVRHAVELPDGDGHAQARPRDRRRLHDRRQARPADAAVDARARRGSSRRPGCPAACST